MAYVENALWLVSWMVVINPVDCFRPDLGTVCGLISELSSKLSYSLCMASLWPVMASGVV